MRIMTINSPATAAPSSKTTRKLEGSLLLMIASHQPTPFRVLLNAFTAIIKEVPSKNKLENQDDIIPERIFHQFGLPYMHHSLIDGQRSTQTEYENRNHKGPKIKLFSITKRMRLVGRLFTTFQSI